MDQNGTSNGHDAKLQLSPPASGANKSPKKRRKVNHGTCSHLIAWKNFFLEHLLILERVPAACVYCRRSVSTALDRNTREALVYATMRQCLAEANSIWFLTSI